MSATLYASYLTFAYDFKLGVFVGDPNQKLKDATEASNACGRKNF